MPALYSSNSLNMENIIKIIGQGRPAIAIVGCVHGDEIMGKKVIKNLKRIKLKKGSLCLIIAHPQAVQKKKRFFKKDLNRCFPGRKNGLFEEKLAHKLYSILQKYDLVIDLHATNSSFKKLIIIARFNIKIKEILKHIPIQKVALVYKKIFGGKEMIAHCKAGISLEYGPDKTGKNYKLALSHIKIILRNLGVLFGKKKIFNSKELYKVSGVYRVSKKFNPNNRLKNFYLIKKGRIIGKINQKAVKSKLNFYPLFLGKGRYKKTLALISNKENINLQNY